MKRFNLLQTIRGSALALSFIAVTAVVSASAQNNNNATLRTDPTPRVAVERDDDTNWSWLGLLGLAGLAGLLKGSTREVVQHNVDHGTTRRP